MWHGCVGENSLEVTLPVSPVFRGLLVNALLPISILR
jgi:hypothetical protein